MHSIRSFLLRMGGCRLLPAHARWWGVLFLVALVSPVWAKQGIDFQMALGNPTAATTDPSKTNNYLISRSQYAMSYNGINHQANWVSWSFSTPDDGTTGRTDAWSEETALPTGYYRVGTATFGTSFGESWDRGHMCPSADRTTTTTDNAMTFRMSNMIPQAAQNNQGLWANFETYTRSLAADGDEILIVSGPAEFTGNRLSNQMAIPGSVWKIIVEVPNATSTTPAYQRVTTNSRVIAILTPNTSTGLGTWQSYITSVEEIEAVTGFTFFTNIDPAVATYLKNVVDSGTGPNKPTVITGFSPASGPVGTTVTITGYNFGTTPTVQFNGISTVASVAGGSTITAMVPVGAGTGPITVSGTGGVDTSATAFAVGTGTEPALSLSAGAIGALASVEGSAGTSQSYMVSGSNLIDAITVTAPTHFEISLTNSDFAGSLSLSPVSGNISQTVYVRIKSTAPLGSVSGVIAHSGGGATTQNLSVSGTVASSQPALTLSTATLTGFSALQGSVSTSKSYTVSGVNLSGAITVTPPSGYEISTNNSTFVTNSVSLAPSGTTLAATPLYARIHSSAPVGTVSGQITHAGGGATGQNLTVSGTVTVYTPGQSSDVVWNFDTATPTSGVPSMLTVGPLAQGNNNGITTLLTTSSASSGYTGASGGGNAGAAARIGALVPGANGSAYFEVTVTPDSNAPVLLTGVSLGMRSTSTGPQAYAMRSSADGYASDIFTGTVSNNSAWTNRSQTNLSFSSATAVTFRLYGYGGAGSPTTNTANWRIDDLKMSFGSQAPVVMPVITSTSSFTATNYGAFSYQITASNSPVSYNASGLPAGLSVNTSNGVISGTPATLPGIYVIGLSAINSAGEGTKDLTLTLLKNPGAPVLTSPSSATAHLRNAFTYTASASPSATSFAFEGLPPGLSNSGATITGTPTSTGTFSVAVTASNALGSDRQTLLLTVVDPVIHLPNSSMSGFSSILGKEGSIQSYTVTASNLTGNLTIGVSGHFELSEDNTVFTNNLTLVPIAGGVNGKTMFARLATNAPLGANAGVITHSGGGAISQEISLTGTVIQPQLSLSVTSLGDFTTRVGVVSASQDYTVTGTELTGGITVTPPAGFEISTDGLSFGDNLLLLPTAGSLNAQRVYVRIGISVVSGSLAGSLVHQGGDALPVSLPLTGSVVQPLLVPSVASLNAFSANAGSVSSAQNYSLSGSYLTGPVTVTAPAPFEISLNNSSYAAVQTLTNTGTLAAVPIFVRLSTNAPVGGASGLIQHSGGDAVSVSVAVSGTVHSTAPALGLSRSSLGDFASVAGLPGFSQNYTVSGVNLTGDVTLTAPMGFEVGLDDATFGPSLSLTPVSGSLVQVPVYVRLAASATAGNASGTVTHVSSGAAPLALAVSGIVSAPTPTLTLSTNSLAGLSAVAGSPSGFQGYVLSGSSLKGAIAVISPTHFEIGTSTNSFATNVTLVPSGGVLGATPLYVRIKNSAPTGSLSGFITHSGGGASGQTLSLAGNVAAAGPAFSSPLSGSVYTNSLFSNQMIVGGTNTNATYVFSASGLPAGYSINATNGTITGTATNISRTNFFTVTASNSNGVTTGTYRLRTMTAAEQDAIPLIAVINKFWNNGSSDKLEILVAGYTNQAPPVDMRGMTIKDFNNNMGNDQGGKYVFNDVALWSRVKAGTLVVLSAGTSSSEDLDPSDFVLRVNLGNTAYFTAAAGGFDLANTEMVMIKTADSGSDGIAGGIHLLAVGSPGTQYNNFKGKKMNNTQSLNGSSRTMVGASNSNATLADFYSSTGTGTSSTLVFGSPNSTGNTTFINTLRAKDQDGPVITMVGSNPVAIAHGSSYSDAGASALDGSTSRAVSTNNPVNPNVVGTYAVTYTSSDGVGNVSTAVRTVQVTDQTAPLITLNGSSAVQIPYGGSFSDPGAIATDAVDGDISAYVQVTRPFALASLGSSVGTYLLSYVVADAAGNISPTLTRTVQVTKATPTITLVPSASALITGQALSGSSLTGGSATVPGSFAWSSPSTVPGSAGSYEVTFTPADSANYNTATAMVYVTVNSTPLADWAAGHGLMGGSATPSADPDGDGFSNAQEYAFGLDPTLGGGNPAALSQATNQVKLIFLQKSVGGITYAVKSASTLAGGFTNSVTPQESADQSGVPNGYKRFEAILPTSNGRGFLKVEATIPP